MRNGVGLPPDQFVIQQQMRRLFLRLALARLDLPHQQLDGGARHGADRLADGRQFGPDRGRQRRVVEAAYGQVRSEEHTSELQSLMRISYAVFCLKKKTQTTPP